ncbi:MAG: HEPN family nuclease [Thermoanaerobaculia bacterium]
MTSSQYDLRYEIPARAFINHQILQSPTLLPALDKATQALFNTEPYRNQGLIAGEYSIMNHAQVVSLLYCLIVVPKELLNLPRTDQLFRDMTEAEAFAAFSVSVTPMPEAHEFGYEFLRALRNAISHALFTVDHLMTFSFWTDKGRKWRITIPRDALMSFLSRYGAMLANAALRARSLGAATD